MNLRPTHIILAGFFLLTLTATQCKKEEPKLPPETQVGANTFGCYLNGELFTPSRRSVPGSNEKPLSAGYNIETNQFGIKCIAPNSDRIFFFVDNPREYIYLSFSVLEYVKSDFVHVCSETDNICSNPNSNGRVFLTRFDTVNNIASGRFEFSGDCFHCFGDVRRDSLNIQITSGRFDVKFNNF
jgi:hypothetical protein